MDDALLVANLVYLGTLVIGGALLAFLAAATAMTLVIAGMGQGVASILTLVWRALRAAVRAATGRATAERTTAEGAPTTPEALRAEYARQAVIAKADALLAAKKSAATAASEAAATAREPRSTESEDAVPADDDVAVPAATEPAIVTHMRPAPVRTGPHTGTQPALAVGRAS